MDVAQYDFGNDRVKVESYEEAEGLLDMVLAQAIAFKKEGKDFPIKNLVVDSVSALETLVHNRICAIGDKDGPKKDIEDFGFQGGYKRANKVWEDFLTKIRKVREAGINVWLIGHSTIAGIKTPDLDPYDQYQPALHKNAVALLHRDLDGVLFAKDKIVIRKNDIGMGNVQNQAISLGGDSILYTQAKPAWVAKNRSQPALPSEMAFDLNLVLSSWNKKEVTAKPTKK